MVAVFAIAVEGAFELLGWWMDPVRKARRRVERATGLGAGMDDARVDLQWGPDGAAVDS